LQNPVKDHFYLFDEHHPDPFKQILRSENEFG